MKILDKFASCPACGDHAFEYSSPKSKKCGRCGLEYFVNPSSAVVAIIANERGELLVARRALEPAKGTLDLPGGFADVGETLEEAVAREVMEETGLAVSAARYLFSLPNMYRYAGIDVPTLDAFFVCEVPAGVSPKAMDDVAECFWVAEADVRTELFGLDSVREGVRRYLASRGIAEQSDKGV